MVRVNELLRVVSVLSFAIGCLVGARIAMEFVRQGAADSWQATAFSGSILVIAFAAYFAFRWLVIRYKRQHGLYPVGPPAG